MQWTKKKNEINKQRGKTSAQFSSLNLYFAVEIVIFYLVNWSCSDPSGSPLRQI